MTGDNKIVCGLLPQLHVEVYQFDVITNQAKTIKKKNTIIT